MAVPVSNVGTRCRSVSRVIREAATAKSGPVALCYGSQARASRIGPESAAGQVRSAEVAAELSVRFSEASARWLCCHAICASLQPSPSRPVAIARQVYRPSRALSSSTGYGSWSGISISACTGRSGSSWPGLSTASLCIVRQKASGVPAMACTLRAADPVSEKAPSSSGIGYHAALAPSGRASLQRSKNSRFLAAGGTLPLRSPDFTTWPVLAMCPIIGVQPLLPLQVRPAY